MPLPDNTQHRTLAAYLSLTRQRQDWQRSLVLLDAAEATAPLAFAARIAGAAILWISHDPEALRQASHDGITDFNVTILAEAIRILKNEIRKGTPVAVGLLDETGQAWEQVVLHGLQPQALLTTHPEAAQTLLARGATDLAALTPASGEEILTRRAGDWRERQAQDEALLDHAQRITGVDRTRATRWLHAAPRLFPRDLHRCYLAAWSASNPA